MSPRPQRQPPRDAISVEQELPPNGVEVLAWVSDEAVAIYAFPVVARRDGDFYWSGVPGNWIELTRLRWKLTHWRGIEP